MMKSYKSQQRGDASRTEINGARAPFLLPFSGRKPYFAQQEYLLENLGKQSLQGLKSTTVTKSQSSFCFTEFHSIFLVLQRKWGL